MANDEQMPERIWLDAATYNGAVGFAHAKRKDEGQWQEFVRADLCASGQQVRAVIDTIRQKGERIEREANACQDVGASLEAKIRIKVCDEILAALTPAPQPREEGRIAGLREAAEIARGMNNGETAKAILRAILAKIKEADHE